jgi:GT2 family glycosyltransferase/glycosyltransferase involved in cell wall biosynthesis
VLDEFDSSTDAEGVNWLGLAQIGLAPEEVEQLPVICDPEQLAVVIKPRLLHAVLGNHRGPLFYFWPQAKVFSRLDQLANTADARRVLIAPLASAGSDGVFDPTFIRVSRGCDDFLDQWSAAMKEIAFDEPQKLRAAEHRWFDAIPVNFAHSVLQDQTCNVSYQNINGRKISEKRGRYLLDGAPLRVFKFDGFDPDRPHLLSIKDAVQPRLLLSEEPAVAKMCSQYRAELLDAGWERAKRVVYGFGELSNGIRLDPSIRKLYLSALKNSCTTENAAPPQPFAPDGESRFAAWLNDELRQSPAVTRYMIALHDARADLRQTFPDPLGEDAHRFAEWFESYGKTEEQTPPVLSLHKFEAEMSASNVGELVLEPRVNLVGYFHAELGLGEAARGLAATLAAAGVPFDAFPYRDTASRQNHPFEGPEGTNPRGDISILCINADQLPRFAARRGAGFLARRYTIGVWFWEIEDVPPALHEAFQYVDEIWVASAFMQQNLARVSPRPVFEFDLAITPPLLNASFSRADLGLPEDRYMFLFSFDFLSVLERKNPLGLIDAFRRAFRPGEGPVLVIKTINGSQRLAELEKLRLAASRYPDVMVHDGYVSAADKNSVIAQCDCYVSLHRAEGFALTLAEAMALGRPTIATNYSGNLSFMTAENSWLCGYTLQRIGPDAPPYPADAHWAAPDVNEAANLLRYVYEHREEAAARAQRGQRDIAELRSPAAAGRRAAMRIEEIRRRLSSGEIKSFPKGAAADGASLAAHVREDVARAEAARIQAEAERESAARAVADARQEIDRLQAEAQAARSEADKLTRAAERKATELREQLDRAEAEAQGVRSEAQRNLENVARVRAEARAAQRRADSFQAQLEKAERATWDEKVRRADAAARLRERDETLRDIRNSAAWKVAKPFWLWQRHFRQSPSSSIAAEELLFAIDAPQDWTNARETLVVRGWCFSRGGKELAGVRAKVGKKGHFARYGLRREDLKKAFPAFPEAVQSGFAIDVRVPHGSSIVRLEAITAGGAWQPFFEHEVTRIEETGRRESLNGNRATVAADRRVARRDEEPLLFRDLSPEQLIREAESFFLKHKGQSTKNAPLFSIITPTFNTTARWLAEAAVSVARQTCSEWEWCIVDDGSADRQLRRMLERIAAASERVRVKFAPRRGISAATNDALDLAAGQFVCFLDHDDLLHPTALESILVKLGEGFDVVYTDENKLDDVTGKLVEDFFKPDWSPEYLRGAMYVGHLLCVRSELAKKVRFDPAFDGVQDFEFMLRLSEIVPRIGHIPRSLYHWRKTPGSIAEKAEAKPQTGILQQRAVNAHLERVGLRATAELSALPHRLTLVPTPADTLPKISIVIPTKDAPELLATCLQSIFTTTSYPDYEVVLIDNGTTDETALSLMRQYPVRRVDFAGRFNFSRANNLGAHEASGRYLVFLNNDTEIVAADWLEHLLYYAEQEDVGAAGALLLYENRTVQHAGVVLGMRGTADHVMRGFPAGVDGYAGSLVCAREVTAVTAACMMISRSRFEEVGGFNEHFFTIYQDLDLCLRLRQRGLRIIHVPAAVLTHHESVSRKSYYDMVDRMLLLDQWESLIDAGDPYYNPNLDLERGDYSIRTR